MRLAERGNLVPLVREIAADLDTPLSLFRRLDDGRTSFLFESVQGGEKWARWSFMGSGARAAVYVARDGEAPSWREGGAERRVPRRRRPAEVAARAPRRRSGRALPEDAGLPRFAGGAVGAIAWDWVRFVERVPDANPDELGFPDAWFVLPETVVAYDNARHVALVIREVELRPGDDPAARWREARDAVDATVARLREPLAFEPQRARARADGRWTPASRATRTTGW